MGGDRDRKSESVCVFVCVCVRERERVCGEVKEEGDSFLFFLRESLIQLQSQRVKGETGLSSMLQSQSKVENHFSSTVFCLLTQPKIFVLY